MLVLARQVGDQRRHRRRRAQRHGYAVDLHGAAPARPHDPPQDQPVGLVGVGQLCFGQRLAQRVAGRKLEHGDNFRPFLAFANQPRPCPPAQREPQPLDQQRLAGAGLAGQHNQAAPGLQVDVGQRGEIPDRELNQHRCPRVSLEANVITRVYSTPPTYKRQSVASGEDVTAEFPGCMSPRQEPTGIEPGRSRGRMGRREALPAGRGISRPGGRRFGRGG
jgi:hypothetical protein